ncbi:NAD(P)-dependent oxidoreductase [Nodosilinea sp. LEGE 06152]|uniref:NAD-dependent epimerase/dehydratase family protein n=1 Tax=Nodosilinea sp. LEGE 06152 TaxID=2777966 RepID=UPI00187E3429|nr:NAD(P)-dependent oxidoreductase [Nodosilinea sp. LEGE 06152]MBE9159884.1 NAD(P)-dependent oxidoreductase [Nodosilinea sp. LEGE 06152]
MKIFVAGGTGAIGRPVLDQLLAKGHSVVALTRSQERAQSLAAQGIEPAIADVFDADSVKAAIAYAQPEVVIEQLTALPKTYSRESMAAAGPLNTRIRLEGGANVLAAAQAAGVRRYLRQSVAFWGIPGAGLADEQTPLSVDASPAVAADARLVTEIERRLLESNLEGIALRYGFFYGPGTWFNPDGDVAQQVRQQQFPIVGNGDGLWSWLHIEDAAIATVAAAEQGNPGVYLIADDQPLPVREWLPAFARSLNAPPPPQVAVEDALKLEGGADIIYYQTQMRGASNAKAKRELNFQPRSLEWVVEPAVTHAS